MCDIKKELKNYNNLKKRLKALNKEKSLLKLEGGELYSSPFYEKVQSSNISDLTCSQALYNIDRMEKLENKIKAVEFEINTLDNFIEILPETEKKTITYKYIYKYSWVKICDLMGFSEKTGRDKINNCIERLDFIFNKYGYIA